MKERLIALTEADLRTIGNMFTLDSSAAEFREKLEPLLRALELDEISFEEMRDEAVTFATDIWVLEDCKYGNPRKLYKLFGALMSSIRKVYDQLPARVKAAEIMHYHNLEDWCRVKDRETELEYIISRSGNCVLATSKMLILGCDEVAKQGWQIFNGKTLAQIPAVSDIKIGVELRKNPGSTTYSVVKVSNGKVVLCNIMFVTTNAARFEIITD